MIISPKFRTMPFGGVAPPMPDDVAERLAHEADPKRQREKRLAVAEMEANADRHARQVRLRRAMRD